MIPKFVTQKLGHLDSQLCEQALLGLRVCPSVRGLTRDSVAEVADVIIQKSEICFTKAWTSGQPTLYASTFSNNKVIV
jgi:hypothetical protein